MASPLPPSTPLSPPALLPVPPGAWYQVLLSSGDPGYPAHEGDKLTSLSSCEVETCTVEECKNRCDGTRYNGSPCTGIIFNGGVCQFRSSRNFVMEPVRVSTHVTYYYFILAPTSAPPPPRPHALPHSPPPRSPPLNPPPPSPPSPPPSPPPGPPVTPLPPSRRRSKRRIGVVATPPPPPSPPVAPCTVGKDFLKIEISEANLNNSNNLGGMGPDFGFAEATMRFYRVGVNNDGRPFDMVVRNATEYVPPDSRFANGLYEADLGRIWLQSPDLNLAQDNPELGPGFANFTSYVTLRFEMRDTSTNEPVNLTRAYLTFYDLDTDAENTEYPGAESKECLGFRIEDMFVGGDLAQPLFTLGPNVQEQLECASHLAGPRRAAPQRATERGAPPHNAASRACPPFLPRPQGFCHTQSGFTKCFPTRGGHILPRDARLRTQPR